MKRILFVAANDRYAISDNLYPPLWPAFLAAYAERHLPPGRVEFRWDTGPIMRLLDLHRPDILAISSVTRNYGIAEYYAKQARSRGIAVIMGGMHITNLPQSLSPDMDVACMGEGEQTFCDLLRVYLETGRLAPEDLQQTPGLALPGGIVTGTRSTIPRMDDLPHPKRALVGYRKRAYIHTSRGCAYQCVFCSAARFWGKVRYASTEYIMEELAELVTHGARVVRFADDDFSSNLPRLRELSEKIRERGFHKCLKFSCWCRANHVTPELVSTLRSMNVVSVKLGLESGSQRVLNYLKGPGITVEKNRAAVRLLKEGGMQVNADFLFGSPDETAAEMQETYQFIRQSPIDFFDLNIFSPLPNTPVWELARERGLVNDKQMDWSRLNYKFIEDPNRAINLSRRLSHDQLKTIHSRFRRLRIVRSLSAALRSPWRAEIAALSVKAAFLLIQRSVLTLFASAPPDTGGW